MVSSRSFDNRESLAASDFVPSASSAVPIAPEHNHDGFIGSSFLGQAVAHDVRRRKSESRVCLVLSVAIMLLHEI